MKIPKHPKARSFLQKRLFHGLSSFSELESRISSLPTKKDRGNAFEVFAEAYLATQPGAQAKEVWPFATIPLPIKERFGLDTGIDMGVDGIFQTYQDQFSAYQVKFRFGRPSLTWSELSTFMGLTDQIAKRVLFTNCADLPLVMNKRTGFYCIRGSDLDRLEPKDFEAILGWLKSSYVPTKKKEPQPHQIEALGKILSAFEKCERVTTVMACGTGKTLVALWTAERMGCTRILVLVPALALLRQTLHEWLRETHWETISYLCVCSDPTVERDVDDLIVRQSDLDFPISTDSETVREFCEQEFAGIKVVFSTYQSSPVVAEGMIKANPFELGIFDEAHKTAAREGAKFSFALKDENLPIRNRLFMTATPRHYDVRKKDREGESKIVYSMDVPEVYGPVVYKLSFAEAARRDIICNYKVIISVVTSEMVNAELLRRSGVIVDGYRVMAHRVANQIALQKAVEKYNLSKVFTFHTTLVSAKSFTQPGSEGISNYLTNFEAYHVNGTMPTAKREDVMKAFGESENAVMSNARCLTEGIDVPAVDMVAFLAPKRSRVDIVQATGRAMRKKPGKTTGYVLVPLFVERATGESVEEAVERREFEEVWDVLQAMQEQDDILVEIIRKMREEFGQTGTYDDSRFYERVSFLGPELSLDTLRESIITVCIEKLGRRWDERYGELKAFWKRYGHSNVPIDWPDNPGLAYWVTHQRVFWKQGKLSEDRIQRLDEIGFIWDPQESVWEEMFSALVDFKKTHGHCKVPKRWPENPKLGHWVVAQRQQKRKGLLSEERIRILNELGFIWDGKESIWQEMFSALVDFKKTHGHCDVRLNRPKKRKLDTWVAEQRRELKMGQLTEDRIQRLDEIGFIWDPQESVWEEMFSALVDFKKTHGHCKVPKTYGDSKLYSWVSIQRQHWKKKKLTDDRIQRLDEIGFIWDPQESVWEEMFSALVDFKKTHGHCDVPLNWPENPKLGHWVYIQRQHWKKKKLTDDRIQRLDEIGFIWDKWQEMFSALVDFKKTHGHCDVPYGWLDNPELGDWVRRQRIEIRIAKLSEGRIRRLNGIGFEWNLQDPI